MALNERVFRRGKETRKLPALIFVGASNQLPEDESLNALLDRFLVRVKCDYVHPDLLNEVLLAGWKLEEKQQAEKPTITAEEIKDLQLACRSINLEPIRKQYIDIVRSLRNTGIKVSDRRAVKLQNLIAASAFICRRQEAKLSDLWVLKHIWDTEEQIEILSSLISNIIEKEEMTLAHPQALVNKEPNAEEVLKDIIALKDRWESASGSAEEQNIVKDKLRYLQSRCDWVKNTEQKTHLQNEIESLWKKILQTI